MYKPLGINTNLYDLQTENGVTEILESNKHYTFYVFPGPSVKKDT